MADLFFKVCSICMTYNHEAFIQSALHGFVIQQVSFPYVSVIIDDASTDRTTEIIERFFRDEFDLDDNSVAFDEMTEYGRVLFANHKLNKQCYFAIVFLKENHYSLKKSKTRYYSRWMHNADYVALCEGDDYWTNPLKLQLQVEFLDFHHDFIMCCSAFSQTENGNENTRVDIVFDFDEITHTDLIKEAWVGTLTTVFRRQPFEEYHPPINNLPMGDLPLWFYFSLRGRIKYLKVVTANYRRLDSSACHFTNQEDQFRFDLSAMEVREYYANITNEANVARPFFSRRAHYIFEMCYKNRWFDFPLEKLWHFVKQYGAPSGYDRLKYWGLHSRCRYLLSSRVLLIMGKTK